MSFSARRVVSKRSASVLKIPATSYRCASRSSLAALREADDRTSFHLRAHVGNYSLFLAGVFPDRIRMRAELRGSPGLKYYEAIGRSQYRAASDHRLAHKYDLSGIFNTLSERFETTRLALNDIAERLFSAGETDYSLPTLLNQHGHEPGLDQA